MPLGSDHMTVMHAPAMQRNIELTYPGQAAWADQSLGKSCTQCRFWKRTTAFNGKCAQAKAMLGPERTAVSFPGTAHACRYFEGKK